MLRIKQGLRSISNRFLSTSEQPNALQIVPAQKLTRFAAFKGISKLGLTVALSYTFSIELVLASFFLYRLSENADETASVALITTLWSSVLALGDAPLLIMNIPASRHLGAIENNSEIQNQQQEENHEEIISIQSYTPEEHRALVGQVFRLGVYEGLVLAPLVMLVFSFSGPLLTDVFGQDPEVAQDVEHFFEFYFWCVPLYMIRLISEQIIFSFRKTIPPMIIGQTNLIVCSLLAYCLGFGALGFPRLGFAGIALSYAIEACLTGLFDVLYLTRGEAFKDFTFLNFCRQVKGTLTLFIDMFKLGLGMTFSMANQMLTSLAASLFAGLLGNEAQSAWGAGLSYMFFAFILMYAFGSMCSLELSTKIGAHKFEEANRVGTWGLLTTFIYVVPIPTFFACYPQALVSLLSLDETIAAIIPRLLPLVSAGVICDAARYNVMMQLRVLKQHRIVALISFLGMLLGVAATWFLGLETPMGIYGIATGYLLASFAGLVILGMSWLREIQPTRMQEQFTRIEEIKEEKEENAASVLKPVSNCMSALFSRVKRYVYGQTQEERKDIALAPLPSSP